MHKKVEYEPMLMDQYEESADESTLSDSSYKSDKVKLDPKQGCARFCLHLRLLLYKNVLLFWRSKKITLFQLLTPIISLSVIFFLQTVANDFQDIVFPNPPVLTVNKLPHCRGDDCVTLGYGIIGDSNNPNDDEYEWIHHTASKSCLDLLPKLV